MRLVAEKINQKEEGVSLGPQLEFHIYNGGLVFEIYFLDNQTDDTAQENEESKKLLFPH